MARRRWISFGATDAVGERCKSAGPSMTYHETTIGDLLLARLIREGLHSERIDTLAGLRDDVFSAFSAG